MEKEEDVKKVTFQMVSDLHLEFKHVIEILPTIDVCSRILCLLGDIGYPDSKVYQEFLLSQAERFEHVIVISGNHEYYKQKSHELADAQIQEICNLRTNLHFLNRTTFELDGVVFLGCTLWPLIPDQHIEYIEYICNDYKMIHLEPPPEGVTESDPEYPYLKRKRITGKITNEWYHTNVEWLKTQIIQNSLLPNPKTTCDLYSPRPQ